MGTGVTGDPTCVLGTKCRPSARAVCAPNHEAASLAPDPYSMTCFNHCCCYFTPLVSRVLVTCFPLWYSSPFSFSECPSVFLCLKSILFSIPFSLCLFLLSLSTFVCQNLIWHLAVLPEGYFLVIGNTRLAFVLCQESFVSSLPFFGSL